MGGNISSGKGGGSATGGSTGGFPRGSSGGSGGGSWGSGMMKAPGGGGSYILRADFEANPKGYFAGLRGGQKGSK
ncbi:hypothetical protein NMG60_11020593 [Bertholletia excelsa]